MRFSIRPLRQLGAFTLIELLTVMTVIAILSALVLSISGWATKKGALARAELEIKALSSACESFKADNGTYPHQPLAINGVLPATSGTIPSDQLDPRSNGISVYTPGGIYANASLELYEALSGDLSLSGTGGGPGTHNYISDMKPDTLGRNNMSEPVGYQGGNLIQYLSDPFGNCYGYSTANSTMLATGSSSVTTMSYPSATAGAPGYNPTFDIWSTGGSLLNPYSGTSGSQSPGSPGDPMLQWVKNW